MSFFDVLKLKNRDNTVVNPSTEDSSTFMRKIVKLAESLGSVDVAGRQRVTIDSITGSLTLGTVSTITNAVPVGNLATIAGLDQRQFMDQSRINYSTGIRANLKWS